MRYIMKLPELGHGLVEALVVSWEIEEGDYIAMGEAILTVETDKATVDVIAEYTGKIVKKLVRKGDIISVNSPLCEISEIV